jgi:hypothetical protein
MSGIETSGGPGKTFTKVWVATSDPRGTPEENRVSQLRHDLSMARLDNNQLRRRLDAREAELAEWRERFDKVLALMPAIQHDCEVISATAHSLMTPRRAWWRGLFSGQTDRLE